MDTVAKQKHRPRRQPRPPSRILIVLLISFGITTLPKSSILRTIPVAFIYTKISLLYKFVLLVSVKQGDLYFNIYLVVMLCYNIKNEIERSEIMRPHYSYDLGMFTIGGWSATAAVHVIVHLNYAANVLLLDPYNYNNYCSGMPYSYYGGYAQSSPVTLSIPSSGIWTLVVDNGGDPMGNIQASVSTETINTF